MKKIAINTRWGGFHLSAEAVSMLQERGVFITSFGRLTKKLGYIDRDDKNLIEVIEKLGDKASYCEGEIKIAQIPEEVDDWYISNYDGQETVCEGRTWGADEEG